ncbi:MAG: hypothetical protein WD512_19500 [Candidatus Paceibacterota bacterium]
MGEQEEESKQALDLFQDIIELIDKNVKFFVTVNGWLSTYEAEIDLVFNDIDSRFMWKYHGSMPIWHSVQIKKYSSHIYINNEVIFYKP